MIYLLQRLAHGVPGKEGNPKTRMETYGYPVILAVIFGISLLIFHHAPHDKSVNEGFKLPTRRTAPIYDTKIVKIDQSEPDEEKEL
jgi:hypothetical protein